jgi:hypothetical protein
MTDDLRLRIARDLRAITHLYEDLREEAINRAGDPDIPGGDAMVMLGPGADVEAFGYAQISTYLGRTPGWVEEPLPDDLEPPLSFLAGWSDLIREERDMPTALKATISREVDYIRSSLDWMLSYDESGVPKQTVHSWIRRNEIRAVCSVQTKRLMVWWPDVRDHMQTRGKRDAS